MNGKEIKFLKACICTGSRPKIPKIKGIQAVPYFTTETIFNVTTQPKNMLIIGNDSRACELAQSFHRLGTKVTIITKDNSLLSHEDHDVAFFLVDKLVSEGIEIKTNCQVIEMQSAPSKGLFRPITVSMQGIEFFSKTEDYSFDTVLLATGCVPNIEGLKLENAGIEVDKNLRAIKTDKSQRTSNSNVYAAGSCCGSSLTMSNSET